MGATSPELVDLEPQHVLTVRGELPVGELPLAELGDFFPRAFGEAMAAAEATGAEIVGPPFGWYPEWSTSTVLVEAGFPVAAPAAAHGPAHPSVLPGGRAARLVHVGPYETLPETYDVVWRWMADHGLQATTGMWERYLTDPGVEPDPASWRTEVICPIA